MEFDIVLLKKPGTDGLTKTECMNMFELLKDREAYPIEIFASNGEECSAMGFVGAKAAKAMDYDYQELNGYIGKLLSGDVSNHETYQHAFHGIAIYLR